MSPDDALTTTDINDKRARAGTLLENAYLPERKPNRHERRRQTALRTHPPKIPSYTKRKRRKRKDRR